MTQPSKITEDGLPNNSLKDLMDFFSKGSKRPVTPAEMKAFWTPLTDAEKLYYKTATI